MSICDFHSKEATNKKKSNNHIFNNYRKMDNKEKKLEKEIQRLKRERLFLLIYVGISGIIMLYNAIM
ncbi:hypothetical protein [uncultured Bacteroides sp.]|uniref:hypothetical protein n=1 Tax=uncultured Bacteroides sp. TaxID=162156 RepID=UPI0025E627A0|nr:hypothetical protein [uncultured Bacteroides sp.]